MHFCKKLQNMILGRAECSGNWNQMDSICKKRMCCRNCQNRNSFAALPEDWNKLDRVNCANSAFIKRRTNEELMKNWWKTDEELVNNCWRTDEELMDNWRRTVDLQWENMKKNKEKLWKIIKKNYELMKNWRRTGEELMKNWWRTDVELMNSW